jgi:predicted transcriptional regulator
MSTKLTLNIDEKVIDRAKKYARRHKVSVSKIVENYLGSISTEQNKSEKISPLIEWLAASDNNVVVDKNDILEELIRKNRK